MATTKPDGTPLTTTITPNCLVPVAGAVTCWITLGSEDVLLTAKFVSAPVTNVLYNLADKDDGKVLVEP